MAPFFPITRVRAPRAPDEWYVTIFHDPIPPGVYFPYPRTSDWSPDVCYPVTCPRCRKTTWDGCGAHVDQVMNAIPADRRCTCNSSSSPQTGATGLFAFTRR